MSTSPQKPAGTAVDLEATAELPIMDFDAMAEGGTDTFATLEVPAVMPDLAETLRGVETHLKRKTERLRELEGQLTVAEAAEQELRTDLDSERRAAADQLTSERRSSAELLERERKAATEQLEHERRSALAQLEAERKSAVEQLERTRREALTQLETERASAARASGELNQRLAAVEQTLVQTRGMLEIRDAELSATRERLTDHQQQVSELRQSSAQHDVESRRQGRELEELRRRAEHQHEALTRSQGFRGVLEMLLTEREETLSGLEQRHAAELQANQARGATQIQQASEREASLRAEKESATAAMQREHEQRERQLRSEHAAHEEKLVTGAATREAALKAEHTTREAKQQAQHEAREAGLQAQLAATQARLTADNAALDARLTAEKVALETRLTSEHTALAAGFATREANLTGELDALRAGTSMQIAGLESAVRQHSEALAETRQRLEGSESQVRDLSAELQAHSTTIEQQQAELLVLRANDEAARSGAAAFEQQAARIRELESDLAGARLHVGQVEKDLRAAHEKVDQLESDARASVSLLGNLQQNMARLGREDMASRPALKLVGTVPERFLISKKDGVETTRALGRRTGIGRTPDNEIQIDASYVSRHHAVILSNEQHCIIEDLNSMNGVLINGKRISRHALRDGDIVKIGRAVFRFREP